MSTEYIAFIGERESSLLSYAQLHLMWDERLIEDGTPIRTPDSSEWSTWGQLRNSKSPAKSASFDLPGTRRKLRRVTAYPILRGFLVWVIVLAVIGIIASALCLFVGNYLAGVSLFIGALASIFSVFLTMAVLDIADAMLKNSQ